MKVFILQLFSSNFLRKYFHVEKCLNELLFPFPSWSITLKEGESSSFIIHYFNNGILTKWQLIYSPFSMVLFLPHFIQYIGCIISRQESSYDDFHK
jgi:hypothetical protein